MTLNNIKKPDKKSRAFLFLVPLHHMRKIYTLISLHFLIATVIAGPGTYYNSLDTTKSCANFKTQLYNLIKSNTTVIPYAQVDNYFNSTDYKPSETGTGNAIIDKYSSENPFGTDYCNFQYPADFCLGRSSSTECFCYDKEHVFPKSWFGGTDMYPMYSDLMFIWPSDNYVNFRKGNLPLGYVNSPFYTSHNGTKIGTSKTASNYNYSNTNVFEPIDSFKGDFARAYLYVITRYEDSIVNWTNRSIAGNMLDGNKYPGFKSWLLQLCVKWHKLDPPGTQERNRNDAVQYLQGNRNPYIDHPEWVEKVFGPNGLSGSCVPTALLQKQNLSVEIFPNPVQNILHIRTENNDTYQLTLTDILGRTVFNQTALNTTFDISTGELAKGIYLLQIKSDKAETVKQIIVE